MLPPTSTGHAGFVVKFKDWHANNHTEDKPHSFQFPAYEWPALRNEEVRTCYLMVNLLFV